MFEGMTFCDYAQQPFVCKPRLEMYEKAEEEAGAQSVEDCYFVGIDFSLPHAIKSLPPSLYLFPPSRSTATSTIIIIIITLNGKNGKNEKRKEEKNSIHRLYIYALNFLFPASSPKNDGQKKKKEKNS